MKYLLFVISFLVLADTSDAQSTKVVQVSGVVVASDSLLPVPYVTIYRSRDHRGAYSDYNGYFTLPVHVGDTLNFFCMGLKTSSFVVPNDTLQTHLSVVQWMEVDTVMLPTVNILPFPEPHKLRSELLALDLPGDHYQRFSRDQISLKNYDGMYDVADEAYRQASATMVARYTNGFQSGGNLLDPGAWSRFMKSLKRGDSGK